MIQENKELRAERAIEKAEAEKEILRSEKAIAKAEVEGNIKIGGIYCESRSREGYSGVERRSGEG
jgi:hypothetical protein